MEKQSIKIASADSDLFDSDGLCIAAFGRFQRENLNKSTEIVIKKQITNEAIATFDDRIFYTILKKIKRFKGYTQKF